MRLTAIAALLSLAACSFYPPLHQSRPPMASARRVWMTLAPDGSQGTAFPVRTKPRADGRFDVTFITAGHMVQDSKLKIHPTIVLKSLSNVRLTGVPQDPHSLLDVALIVAQSDEFVWPLEMSMEILRLGDEVWLSGFPLRAITLTHGYASSFNRVSSPTAPGGSGSPVLLPDGRAAGVATSVKVVKGQRLWHCVKHVPFIVLRGWLPGTSPQ